MTQKFLIGANVVLSFAVALLFALYFGGKQGSAPQHKNVSKACTPISNTVAMTLAFINTDSLMAKYELYALLKRELMQKQSRSEDEYSRKMKQLEDDFYVYQDKAQKGLFTRNEMQEKELTFQQRQQEMGMLNQRLSEELAQEEQKMQTRLIDSLKVAASEFNNNMRYQMILNNAFGTTVISGNPGLNVTDSIAGLMNQRYRTSQKK